MRQVEGPAGKPGDPSIELILEGGRVLNVYSGEILESNVAIGDGRILYVGPSDVDAGGASRLNVSGRLLVPGYIEPHCHPWNIYNPLSFGEEACRLGTTTLVCDDLIFFMLMGVDRFEAFMEALAGMPAKFFWFIRLVPQTPMENETSLFSAVNLKRLLRSPYALSVGEITRWQELVKGNPEIFELICFARGLGKRVDGHTAGAKYENLAMIARAGVESCHESITAEETLDRLRLGFHVMLRQSSLRKDLHILLKAIRQVPHAARRVMLTTDSSTPAFQTDTGVCDHLVTIAMEEGIDPVEAYRMVTLNPAVYFGMEHRIGGIAPGREADINVLSGLDRPRPEMVLSRGRIVAEKGNLLRPFPKLDWNHFLDSPLGNGPWRAKADFFKVPQEGVADGQTVGFPVIRLLNTVITRIERVEFPVREGALDVSARDGFSWVATLNRHGRWVSNGVIRGYADRVEGIASSFTTAAEIVAIGRDPGAMAAAVNRLLEMGGGIAAVEQGRVAFELPLPLGGLMSEKSLPELAEKDRALQAFLSARGFPFHDPLYTFIFLPNDFLPEVRINRMGVVNIKTGEVLHAPRPLRWA